MTRNPEPLRDLEAHFVSRIGPYWKGTVGDETHFNGYHLGGFEVPYNDYSIVHPRDVAGIAEYGGYWAAAVDPGMEWPASRQWFEWLIGEAQSGKLPDIAEIIGSPDGIQDYRYIAEDGFQAAEVWLRNHILHTHLSIFRDAVFRSHRYLFDGWTSEGRVKVSTTKRGPKPMPVIPTPSASPVPSASASPLPVADESGFSVPGGLLVCGLGALAWVIKRRMEVAREDT